MKILDLQDVIATDTSLSVLTKEKMQHLIIELFDKKEIIGINDDVYEVFLHVNEIDFFFDGDIKDVDIMCNQIFSMPPVKEYLATKADNDYIDVASSVASTDDTPDDTNNELNVLFIIAILNLSISVITLAVTLSK